ncbi:MAG: O-antigen ligase family protein [Solirubrobacterales bacterium]|nr:O-antigen ligase family protein [Solirubrobacterales bacterium]
MSTLASAPTRATHEPAGAAPWSGARREGGIADLVFGVALATGFGVIVFAATGGTDLAPNTWVEIALAAVGAACAIALILLGARGPAWGALTVILFAALAALTYLSISWSVQPANSWVEANRTLAYLAAFGAAVVLARIAPARWPALVWAVGTVAVAVSGYALLAKAFPGSLNAGDQLGRLRVPFSYWNATGLMAGLGLPACLWAGARPGASKTVRALTVPAIAVLLTVLILSYSRGALIAVVVGLGTWLVFVPYRLRATLLLALGAIGGMVATGWALSHHAITHDGATLAARTSAGHEFGVVLLATLAGSALIGLAAAYVSDRTALTEPVRRRIGTALVVLVASVPVAAVAGMAASSRGLTGEVSHVWHTLTSSSAAQPGNNPGRIAALGNSRPLYWSEGLKVGEHALLAGTGAAGFDTAHTRYSSSTLVVAHAHSFVIETFSDFGLIGIAIGLALFVAWVRAVMRTFEFRAGRRPRAADGGRAPDRPHAPAPAPAPDAPHTNGHAEATRAYDPFAPERAGLFTLLAVVVTFGVSSLIDWTWFIPGLAVPALVCAGWLAGRGPLQQPVGRATERRRLSTSPGAAAAGLGIVAATIVAAWFVWQPLHSQNDFNGAITAMATGNSTTALADAQSAAAADPVSVEPLWELSEIYSARHDPAAARQELVKAANVQPSNPETWEQLGEFDLAQQQPIVAVLEFQTAEFLDRSSLALPQQVAAAASAVAKAGFSAPPSPAASS